MSMLFIHPSSSLSDLDFRLMGGAARELG
jgi:hypothetical protein